MMRINKYAMIYILLAVCCHLSTNAQYNISIEIKNIETDTLLLGYYWHGGTYAVDTSVNKKGKFVFKNKKKTLEDGIYFFSDTKGRYCEFLIDKKQNLRFTTNNDNWIKNMKVENDENEQQYFDYLKQSDSLAEQYRQILNGRKKIDKQEYDNRLKILSDENDALKKNFIHKYPKHLLSKILLCTQPLNIPEFPTIYKTDGSVDSIQMNINGFNWYKRHYFDNVDLSCGALLNTHKQVFMDNYNRYWETVMKYEKVDTILYYADYWIGKAKDKKMFNFLVKDITNRYLQSTVMGHDKIYVGMIDRYIKTEKYTDLAPSDIEKNIHRADVWRNLLIGQIVPDLACSTHENNSAWHHIDELTTKYKLLVFWSIDCGHCTTEIPKLNEFYKQYKDTYDLEVFAVHTEGDIKTRDEFIRKHDIKWINTNGLFANYDWRKYFDIEKTPIVYILDAKDKILAKNISVDNLKQIMDVLEKGGFYL
ncbi:MAG: thioredoxin-like domain-containing protein [Bacteroidales bacterium]